MDSCFKVIFAEVFHLTHCACTICINYFLGLAIDKYFNLTSVFIRTTNYLDSCSLKCKRNSLSALWTIQILNCIHIVDIFILCPVAPFTYICDSFISIVNLTCANRLCYSYYCTLFRFNSIHNCGHLIFHCSKCLVCCCIFISCCC